MNDKDAQKVPAPLGPVEREVRPACWEFAMDFLGDPEASIVNAYVSSLEAEVAQLRAVQLVGASFEAAILAEREACAKVCEAHADGWKKNPGNNPIAGFIAASNCAGDIRLRSNA